VILKISGARFNSERFSYYRVKENRFGTFEIQANWKGRNDDWLILSWYKTREQAERVLTDLKKALNEQAESFTLPRGDGKI
jgi:hypothetical protein